MITDLTENYFDAAAEISRMSFPDPWSADGISSYIGTENSAGLAYIENGMLIGYLLGGSDGMSAWIDSIAVHEAFRRKGIASALLSAFLERNGHLPITLEVRESNSAAAALYKKIGFEIIGIRKNMYSSPRENAAVMSLLPERSEIDC